MSTMNNTALVLAGIGCLCWLIAVMGEYRKASSVRASGGTMLHRFFVFLFPQPKQSTSPPVRFDGTVTIESLEQELGITPDIYLCERIARINEALVERRKGKTGKKTNRGGIK